MVASDIDFGQRVTCMLQYVLCSPIWINVLNIYAFSNLHDFSWGTKEDNQEEDLGNAAGNKDGTVEVELPTDQADIGELISINKISIFTDQRTNANRRCRLRRCTA